MFPVPPMKRTFRDMGFCLLLTHDGLGIPDNGSRTIVLVRAGAKVAPSIKSKAPFVGLIAAQLDCSYENQSVSLSHRHQGRSQA
jgi:hypothetical protein